MWKACCGVFDYLNLAAVRPYDVHIVAVPHAYAQIIDGETLCVHGGLSPDIRTLDQIRVLSRAQEIPHEGAFCGMFLTFARRSIGGLNRLHRLDVVRSR